MKSATDRWIRVGSIGLVLMFLATGFMTAIKGGIGWDEAFEQTTLNFNLAAIKGLLKGDLEPYQALVSYQDKYYGISFHVAALPLQVMLGPLAQQAFGLQGPAAFLLPKHLLVFALFGLSAVWFFRLLRQFIDDDRVCCLFTLAYCLCPYFLGHGTMNIKDVPFMAIWVISVHRALLLCRQLATEDRAPWKPFVDLGLITGLLLSIRLAGILIVIFYAVVLVAALCARGQDFHKIVIAIGTRIIVAGLIALFVTWIAYPVFWLEPWRMAEAVRYMAAHPWNTCTLTAGVCIPSQEVPATYIPLWLSVKLPFLALLGIALLPFSIGRISRADARLARFGALILGHLLIVLILIGGQAHLYSELRQILFILPIIFLVGLVSLYTVTAKGAIGLAAVSLALFFADNVSLFPYQYTWYNEIARFGEIDGRYETDYWGLSAREAAPIVERVVKEGAPVGCIVARPKQLYRYYLPEPGFPCLVDQFDAGPAPQRPFVIAATSKHGSMDFPGCQIVGTVARTLAVTGTRMTMARIAWCP